MAITVVDTSGAVLPGAAVDIINQDTGVTERTVMTAEDGKVLATLLPAGMYRLVANRPGFNQGEVRDVRVRITETSSATVTLPVAGVTQEITVETAVAQVQLNSPSTGRTLEAETISRLGGEIPFGPVLEYAVSNVSELNEAHASVRVLILCLDPISVQHQSIRPSQLVN